MAKVAIKSEKLTPFGGIFSIMEQFDSRHMRTSNPQPPSKNDIELKEKEATQKKRLKEVKIATRRHTS